MAIEVLETEQHIPGTITLLSNTKVAELNSRIMDIYAECAERYFRHAEDSNIQSRIRAYDNHQRFTFGRAQSGIIPCSALAASGVEAADLKRRNDHGLDQSFFPDWGKAELYEPLLETVNYTVQALLGASAHYTDSAMVTVFCHRVLVRPQQHYKGFFHRDLAPRSGKIGTFIWYPAIRHELVSGLEFVTYSAMPGITLKTLYGQAPDYQFAPSMYAEKALVLGYPHNYAHGVRAGLNHSVAADDSAPTLQDFVSPKPQDFIKDLVIITVSEWSPVED